MNQAVEAFLNEVWKEVTAIYAKESKRINELSNQSRLQAGIMDYLQVAWRKGKHTREAGEIHIDVYEPFSWSDSSYKIEAGAYITELSDELLTEEFFPALCGLVDGLFRSEELGSRFFDYKFEIIFEFERERSKLTLNRQLFNEPKRSQLQKSLEQFIQTKILSDPPVQPGEQDMFFFAQHLANPDLREREKTGRSGPKSPTAAKRRPGTAALALNVGVVVGISRAGRGKARACVHTRALASAYMVVIYNRITRRNSIASILCSGGAQCAKGH